jgi:dTDP-4-dehydrorhamnose reductase
VTALGRPEADLTDRVTLEAALERVAPDVVINAAAYTAVDKAESEEADAFALNADGPRALGAAARKADVPVIHLSTDYVFDGTKGTPYDEDDATGPVSAYGRSKLAGETALASEQPEHLIIRTAWVYAPYGSNFVRTMLRLAATNKIVRVVDDQHGCPTYAPHLAEVLIEVARQVKARGRATPWGIYNAAGAGETTWRGLAEAVFAESARHGLPSAAVVPIATADYPTAAHRPANSRLDGGRLRATFGVGLPDWRAGVTACVAAIAASEGATVRQTAGGA